MGALMTDITATWESNPSLNLPLTDYREATFEEAALFSFKRSTDMHLSNDNYEGIVSGHKSKSNNPYFAFAIKLKELALRISKSEKPCSDAIAVFSLLKEAPMSRFHISSLEQKYHQLVQDKVFLEQKQTRLVEETSALQAQLELSETEFIRATDQLSLLEADVDNLELEIQRLLHQHHSMKKN